MPNFLFAYYGGKPLGSAEEGAKLRAKWQAWVAGLGAAMINPGTFLGKSKTVSDHGVADGGGGTSPLMGFSVIEANDIDAVLEIAKRCPHLAIGTIEVAEMKQM
ncbi:MAG: hypothetical protein FJX11_26055 [Alphaproteobacteria bacterium]|nr:hypothetical protein [Alphaproteobacteria bacterium]